MEKRKSYIKELFSKILFLTCAKVLFHRILLPLKVVRLKKGTFFLWFIFTIIAGLLGPIINVANNCGFNNISVCLSVYEDSQAGTFYTFSIVLIASAIGSLFLNLLDTTDVFKKMKLYFMAICIFPLFFGGIFYSSFTQKQKEELKIAYVEYSKEQVHKSINMPSKEIELSIDWIQFSMFILALLISIYAFCLQYMNANPTDFYEIRDSYLDKEEQGLKQMSEFVDINNSLEDIDV